LSKVETYFITSIKLVYLLLTTAGTNP